MKLQEVLDLLSYSELGQLSIGNYDSTGIVVEDYPKVIPAINMALTALHKRFNLAYGKVVLTQQDGITTYNILDKHVLGDTSDPVAVKYLDDSSDPLDQTRVVKVDSIVNSYGEELRTNDLSDPLSIKIPKYNQIVIPEPVVDEQLEITYVKDHERIEIASLDPAIYEIDLPDVFLECLLYYTAARVHAGTGSFNESGTNLSNMYFNKYEVAAQQLEMSNVLVDVNQTNTNLERNGWV